MTQASQAAQDILKILVATDLHVGFAEKDPVRGEDSFITLEEIFRIGKAQGVDCILLGGDLFHENKPSRRCLVKVMDIFRRYTLGQNSPKFSIVSETSLNFPFPEWFKLPNYDDPNFKIEMPIFSIHGNHDDPAGDGRLAALDVLATANLVNYFGKSDNIDDIQVYPILIEKGITRVALYGLGNIRDERLYRTFEQKKVHLMKPVTDVDDWFKIFVLHQNRAHHTQKSCIHEVMLDTMLDLVIWGHEHECRITPEPSSVADFQIIQPGSSIATSLSDGEAKPKHVGILEIKEGSWRIRPIPLTTVRPFILRDINLASAAPEIDITSEEEVSTWLAKTVEEIIAEVPDVQPLIRLKVDVTEGVKIHPARFGQRFVGRVANPREILLFHKKKKYGGAKRTTDEPDEITTTQLGIAENINNADDTTVGEIIQNLLASKDKTLEILPESDLNEALHQFVDKDSKSAIADLVEKVIKDTYEFISKDESLNSDPEAIRSTIKQRTEDINRLKTAEHQLLKNSQVPDARMFSQEDKKNIKLIGSIHQTVTEDDDEDNDDFISDLNIDVKLESPTNSRGSSPKRTTRARASSTTKTTRTPVKEEPVATPAKRGRKRKIEEALPDKAAASATPAKRARASSTKTPPPPKAKPTLDVISLSDSDEEPAPKKAATPQPATRKWGGRKQ